MQTLLRKKEIRKQTSRAVLVYSDMYEEIFTFESDDLDAFSENYDQRRRVKDVSEFWLPLSQIEIENNYVVKVKGWLAQKFNLKTKEKIEFIEKKREEGASNYLKLLEKAKELGIKGVRKGMKTRTIFAKAKGQGIPLENLL